MNASAIPRQGTGQTGRSVIPVVIHTGGREPRLGFEKRYTDRRRAEQVYRTWRLLEGVDFGPSRGVPRLAGWNAARGWIRSWAAEGVALDELRGSRLAAGAEAAARWLAALHGAALPLERSFDIRTELRNTGRWAREADAAHPRLNPTAESLHRRLRCSPAWGRLSDDVPLHKDFHPHHVLIGDCVVVVDFDEARLGDPAFDVAHFCVYLRLLALRRHGSFGALREAEGRFTAGYATVSGRPLDQQLVPAFSAYTCLKIAKQLARRSGPQPRPKGKDMVRQLQAVLAHGHRCLEVD